MCIRDHVYFVFRSLQFRYPSQRLKMISDQHASYWIDFGNGNAPWTEYKHSGDGKEIIAVAELRDGSVSYTHLRATSLRISYAVFCLKNKIHSIHPTSNIP